MPGYLLNFNQKTFIIMGKLKIRSEAQLKRMSLKELEDYNEKMSNYKKKQGRKDTLVKSLSKFKK
jgi:hypothetical protein